MTFCFLLSTQIDPLHFKAQIYIRFSKIAKKMLKIVHQDISSRMGLSARSTFNNVFHNLHSSSFYVTPTSILLNFSGQYFMQKMNFSRIVPFPDCNGIHHYI